MQEAMDRLQEEQNRTTTSKQDILEYLAFSTYMQGLYRIDEKQISFSSLLTWDIHIFN